MMRLDFLWCSLLRDIGFEWVFLMDSELFIDKLIGLVSGEYDVENYCFGKFWEVWM